MKSARRRSLHLVFGVTAMLFLFLSTAWSADRGPISSAQTQSGFLHASDGYQDVWTFEGTAGDRVVITASRISGGVEPNIYLHAPDNSGIEASSTGAGNRHYLERLLAQSGLYTIIILDYRMDEEGDYAVALAKMPGAATSTEDPDGGAIDSGQSLTGTLSPSADTDIYQFYGAVGEQVVITASRISGGVEPNIYLHAPDNSGIEASSTGAGNRHYLERLLAQSGLYTIIILDYRMDEEGEYSVELDKETGIYNPYPSIGSILNHTEGNFTWNEVPGATSYDLYFGKNETTPNDHIGHNLTIPSFPFPTMVPGTVYFWNVIAHTPSGDIHGPVWWFKFSDHPYPCFGDFDGDGDIDGADLFYFSGHLPSYNPASDFLEEYTIGFGRSGCPQISYKVHGLNFSPYMDGQDPNLGTIIGEDQIRERLFTIAPYTDWIRTFGTTHGLERIGPVARNFNLKNAIGAWISNDLQVNSQQIQNLITVAQNGVVDLAIIGSEVLLRGDLTAQQLIDYINQFKSAVPQVQVTTADTYNELLDHPDVMAACDVILVNYYPFWEQIPIQHAMARVHDKHREMIDASDGKKVIVSESGWPSDGEPLCGAVPSLENACDFFTNFVSWAREEEVDYFYFEAFDESWKAAYEGDVGAHWGVWDKDGNMKTCMSSVFDDIAIDDNWSCQDLPGGPGEPNIAFTYVPAYGTDCNLAGTVRHVPPGDYKVAVYIRVGSGWWTKPYWDQPSTMLDCRGFWSCDIVTYPTDVSANTIIAFLIPADYTPPLARGETTLPDGIIQNAVTYVQTTRSP